MNSLQYFFTYEKDIPEGIGFGIFGLGHWLWLALLTVLTIVLLRKYVAAGEKTRRIWSRLVGFSMPVWMLLRAIYIFCIGESFRTELPLHLCSMTGLLCALHCVTGWKWLGQVLYAIGLPGTILALIFPDWNTYPTIHFISVEGFFFHTGIVLYVVSQLYSHGIVPKLGKMWQVMLFLIVVVTPIYFLDKAWDVNYMFVNQPSQGSPLELLEEYLGNPGYLFGYAGLIFLCIFLMDLGYVLVTRRRSTF